MKLRHILAILTAILSSGWAEEGPAARPLKHSDVVFMGGADKASYEAYGATVVDWGGHAWGDGEKPKAEFRSRVKVAQGLGIQYNAGIGMLTEFAGMIKSCPEHERAICRNFDGQPMMVPWLWDQKVDGQTGKNFWFCSNSPLYQKYLRELTARAMGGEPDGYHIDDFGGATGTLWSGGCFCESCMPLFANYLKSHIEAGKLGALSIQSLEGFDYGKFLRAQGVKDNADYVKRHGSLPLDAEFRTFQAKSAGEVVRGLQEHAAKLRGKELARSVNGSPPNLQALVVRPHMDHYSCEIGMGAPGSEWCGVPTKKLTTSAGFVYKCTDMTGRSIAGTADGHSWAYVNEKNAVHLCRYWIAESYAFGHCFMAPSHRQWCYTKEKGTHWYAAKPEDYADLYQFVRKNVALFDGFEAVASVGVLFDHKAWRQGKQDARAIATALLEANTIPFALVPAGDELLDLRLDDAKLARFVKLVTPAGVKLDPEQQKVLDQIPSNKRVEWKDAASLRAALEPTLAVEGAVDVWALPRRNPKQPDSPLVVHLLNRNYDFATDRTAAQPNVTLHLRRSLLGAKAPSKCTAYAPGTDPVGLPVEADGDGVRTKIPELKLWSVLRFE